MTILKKYRMSRPLVLVLCLLAVTNMAFGWGPIAHYLITKEAAQESGSEYQGSATDKVEDYASLPDYVASNDASWFIVITIQTSRLFRWGHGMMDQGMYSNNLVATVPKKATYEDDGRYPGLIMAEILRKSDLSNASEAKKWELVNTVNGFRSHNAADRIVHFDFFNGPEDNMTDQQETDGWTLHHVCKGNRSGPLGPVMSA